MLRAKRMTLQEPLLQAYSPPSALEVGREAQSKCFWKAAAPLFGSRLAPTIVEH